METPETCRNRLKIIMERTDYSLRDLETQTGVSFATLSRFLRGADPSIKTHRRIVDYIDKYIAGLPMELPKPRVVKRFKVGNKSFLVEITEV